MKKIKFSVSRRGIWLAVLYSLLFLAAVFFTASRYKIINFADSQIDEILFYFANGLGNGQTTSVWDAVRDNLPYAIILFGLLLLPVLNLFRDRIRINLNLSLLDYRRRSHVFNPSYLRLRYQLGYACVLFLWGAWTLLASFGVPNYVRALNDSSRIYEENYVDPRTATLKFPQQKRNLIYIFLESTENTILSRQNGGQRDSSIIPELEQLALDQANVSFSHRADTLGGALPAANTTWTAAGMTAQSSGIPLKENILGLGRNDSSAALNRFLPGAYTLGDVLKKHGYNQTFVMGSDARFGGRDKLLAQHGGYNIEDYEAIKSQGKIPSDYKVWWGYEDKKLFEYAKEQANKLSQQSAPFNLQLLTVDTHYTDGWLDDSCATPHQHKYDNVFACSSKQVSDFVSWVKQQPFADNTTIIISGDHLGMQTSYYDNYITDGGYQRTIYNVFINPASRPINMRSRQFTTMDMYPSTLAALGVNIKGERLGLGTNLFSSQPTLLESFGSLEALNAELKKRSSFYERRILSGQSDSD